MKEYLVIFAQLLCVGWLLRTLAKGGGRPEDESLGWFDIRVSGKAPKPPKSPRKPPPPAAKAVAWPEDGRGPRA